MYVKFAVNTLHCKLSDGIVVSHYNGEPWRSGSRGGWACLQKNSQIYFHTGVDVFSQNIELSLKGPSQPPPFSMPSKLLILHGEAKSEFFIIGCAPESMFNYL